MINVAGYPRYAHIRNGGSDMARHSANYAGPRLFAYGHLACPACLARVLTFLGGSNVRAWFVCNACGQDFDHSAAMSDTDVLFDIHHD